MATVTVTAENLAELINKDGIVVLDWWAPWCGPCRAFGPIYDRAANAHPDIVFGKVNTEEERALASQFNITSIPTLMVFRDRVLLYSEPGMLPEKALTALITEIKKLDMEAILRGPTAESEHAVSA